MSQVEEASTSSAHDPLPDEQQEILRKAVRLEWITLGSLAVTVTLVGKGQQASYLIDCETDLPCAANERQPGHIFACVQPIVAA